MMGPWALRLGGEPRELYGVGAYGGDLQHQDRYTFQEPRQWYLEQGCSRSLVPPFEMICLSDWRTLPWAKTLSENCLKHFYRWQLQLRICGFYKLARRNGLNEICHTFSIGCNIRGNHSWMQIGIFISFRQKQRTHTYYFTTKVWVSVVVEVVVVIFRK